MKTFAEYTDLVTKEIMSQLALPVADGAALVSALGAFDANQANSRIEAALRNVTKTVVLSAENKAKIDDALGQL